MLKEKLKNIIIKELIEENYYEQNIQNILIKIRDKKISDFYFFPLDIEDKLKKQKIYTIEQLMETPIENIKNIINRPYQIIIRYVERIKNYIKTEINKSIDNNNEKKDSSKNHLKIIKLIKFIKENNDLYNYLRRDINCIDELNYKNIRNKVYKDWEYCHLDLNKEEIDILKQYIYENITYQSIIYKTNGNYKLINNIYNTLIHYLNKIKYKSILKKFYVKIEELNISTKDINRLKKIGIEQIEDLIEYDEIRTTQLPKIGIKSFNRINECLTQANIIFLNNPTLLKQMLDIENAGIIPKERLKKPIETTITSNRQQLIQELVSQQEALEQAINNLNTQTEDTIEEKPIKK